MGTAKTIIELNGKKYDATTGELLDKSPSSPKTGKHRTVDGFFGRKKAEAAESKAHQPAAARARKPEHSKTLMRSSVKSPVKSAETSKAKSAPSQNTGRVFDIGANPNNNRLLRAKSINKSAFVSRFNNTPSTVIKKAGQASKAAMVASQSAVASLQAKPTIGALKGRFDSALQNASAHEQKQPPRPKLHARTAKRLGIQPRSLLVGAGVVVALFISGFLIYQNLPKFAIRVASARAGFHAALPSYIPSGFALEGQIHYTSGKITVNYHSNSDSRSYSVAQEPSKWSSDSLLDNYVTPAKTPYQTFQDNGKTIYIYNGANATWVDGGVWYNVKASGNLSSEQLLKIANSL